MMAASMAMMAFSCAILAMGAHGPVRVTALSGAIFAFTLFAGIFLREAFRTPV